MLGTKDILMGANTSTPALNDFAKLVATELPAADQEVDCNTLANTIMSAAFEAKRNSDAYRAAYPKLYGFITQGGDMCALSAKMVEVIDAGASKKYAESYRVISAIFFGK